MTDPLRISLDVACSAGHAFRVWTSRIGTWWPPDHTVTGQPGLVVLQGGVGGRIYERSTDGVEHEWGEVTVWQPPARLAYRWYLGTDPAQATEVEIRFLAQGAVATRIEIEHHGWERLGTSADQWRDRNRAGWQTLLPHFAAAIAKRGQLMTAGTKDDPWELKTPPGTSSYTMYKDEQASPPALVCQVGSTTLKYHLNAVDDLHAWLVKCDDWVPLGAADEKKPAAEGTVEAWGRSADNPAGGWYGLRSGYRGRFGMYLPPLLEALGLAEVTHDPRNNRMRAI
jgi:uncharacterized protein YndB with AHSA1/START domain